MSSLVTWQARTLSRWGSWTTWLYQWSTRSTFTISLSRWRATLSLRTSKMSLSEPSRAKKISWRTVKKNATSWRSPFSSLTADMESHLSCWSKRLRIAWWHAMFQEWSCTFRATTSRLFNSTRTMVLLSRITLRTTTRNWNPPTATFCPKRLPQARPQAKPKSERLVPIYEIKFVKLISFF